MASLEALVKNALITKDNLTSKDIIEIENILKDTLEHKKSILYNVKGYKRDSLKDDIDVIKDILKKF